MTLTRLTLLYKGNADSPNIKDGASFSVKREFWQQFALIGHLFMQLDDLLINEQLFATEIHGELLTAFSPKGLSRFYEVLAVMQCVTQPSLASPKD